MCDGIWRGREYCGVCSCIARILDDGDGGESRGWQKTTKGFALFFASNFRDSFAAKGGYCTLFYSSFLAIKGSFTPLVENLENSSVTSNHSSTPAKKMTRKTRNWVRQQHAKERGKQRLRSPKFDSKGKK